MCGSSVQTALQVQQRPAAWHVPPRHRCIGRDVWQATAGGQEGTLMGGTCTSAAEDGLLRPTLQRVRCRHRGQRAAVGHPGVGRHRRQADALDLGRHEDAGQQVLGLCAGAAGDSVLQLRSGRSKGNWDAAFWPVPWCSSRSLASALVPLAVLYCNCAAQRAKVVEMRHSGPRLSHEVLGLCTGAAGNPVHLRSELNRENQHAVLCPAMDPCCTQQTGVRNNTAPERPQLLRSCVRAAPTPVCSVQASCRMSTQT